MTTSRHATDANILQYLEPKKPIAWPRMNDERWAVLDGAIISKLNQSNNLGDRIELLETTIYYEAAKLFGHCQRKQPKNLAGKTRRTKLCISLVKEKNSLLAKLALTVNPQEISGLKDLLSPIRQKIKSLRRGEKQRKKRWLFKKAQNSFNSNPYKAGKEVLDPKTSVFLSVEQSVLDKHKSETVRDKNYNTPLEHLEGLPADPVIKTPFICKHFDFNDFQKILLSRRNKSSPGLNAVPYKVYKKCTQVSSFLFKIFASCLKHEIVPLQWRYAMEVFIPKVNPPSPSNIKDFRPIALLNVEGKLFFSLVSKQLEQHIITNNKFVNTSIQKGCIEKIPGCWEHMSMVWSALKEARQNKSSVANIWLDIANAYGSIPHRLIFFALERYGVDNKWIALIKNYYAGLYTKSFSHSAQSTWHQHFRGIFAGCTVSIILFLAGINIIIEYALTSSASNVILSSKVSLPLVRAFMDDLNLMSTSVLETQNLLSKCTEALSWAGMSFRADKSRSAIILKGKSLNTTPFKVKEPSAPTDFSCYIPSFHSKPVKFLGRIIDGSLSDRKSIKELEDKLLAGLRAIHKSHFKGSQKLWILQHLLIPKVQWALLIYEVSITCAAVLERKVSVFIRKWLNIHPSTTDISLYSTISPCPLPLKSLTNILRSSKISGHLLLRDSSDPLVSAANPKIRVGMWRPETATNIAEAELNFNKIRGPVNQGNLGLGVVKPTVIPKKCSHAYRKLVSSTSQKIEEEKDTERALKLQLQCHWMSWENYIKTNLSWKNILALPPNLLSFCISATYNVLPSPSNLYRWNKEDNASCTLCGKHLCTIAHILGACNFSLTQGRFTFRHDSVLTSLVSVLKTFIRTVKPTIPNKRNAIHFVKAGKPPPKAKTNPTGILHLSSDWVLISDTGCNYIFPIHIALTELRPDVVIFSNFLRRVILLELTCPCEENMSSWHSTKLSKYGSLVEIIRNNNWSVDLFAVEVGARGFASYSLKSTLQKLGLPNNLLRQTIKALGKISMECSFYIWMHRNSKEWTTNNLDNSKCNDKNHLPQNKSPLPQKQAPNNTNLKGAPPNLKESLLPLRHAGFINKGNTCYLNSILQALSVIPSFWHQLPSQSGTISPLLKALTLNLSLLGKRNSPIDPSNFLRAFQKKITAKRGTPFNVNTQQDVPEILQILLDELKGSSPIAEGIISSSIVRSTTCDNCFSSSSTEDKHDIISVPLCDSLPSSLKMFLQPEELRGNNKWFCNACSSFQDSVRECKFVNCGSVIIIQLNRYRNEGQTLFKDNRKVICPSEILNIPVYIDEHLSVSRRFKLKATINHSGTINAGHYWAFVKDNNSDRSLKCNDTSVSKATFKDLSNNSSYIFIYSSE